MWALEPPGTSRRGRILANTPLALIATLSAGWLAVAGLAAAGWLAPSLLRVASVTAAHGGLLAVAVAWGAADGGARLPRGCLLITTALIGTGAIAAVLDPRAALLYLFVPGWLALLTFSGRLEGLGLRPRVSLRPVLVAVAIGALLGAHLLLSASQTLGYALRGGGTALLALWAYDAGANVLSAECFFRGALFNRLQRRWSFAAAATVATAAALLRYVIDPLLPKQVEVMAGALFYLTILSAVDCWLLWWSGSLLPGLIASWLFFLAYRTLAIG
jgi:hypothetical protein